MSRRDARGISEALAVVISAVVGLVVAVGATWVVSRPSWTTFYESLYRVNPEAGESLTGVGADWTAGNTEPAFDFLIALTHAADVLMGVFILLMLFIHWGAFRRLASSMQEPHSPRSEEAVATDGGGRTDGPRSTLDESSGGERE